MIMSRFSLGCVWIGTAAVLNFSACKEVYNVDDSDKGPLLAEVAGQKLFMDDLAGFAGDIQDPQDSIQILRGLVNNWVTEQLMVREAEKIASKDLNLEKLVSDYKASLMKYHYENKIVSEQLDTTITTDELQSYYEKNNTQYLLFESILKYDFVKLPSKSQYLKSFVKVWNEDDTDQIKYLAEKHAEFFSFNKDEWRIISDLQAILPEGLINENQLKAGGTFQKDHDGYQYFVKSYDFVGKNENPPLDYIRGKIISVLLNDRKEILLKRKKQQLFDQYNNTRSVVIHLN